MSKITNKLDKIIEGMRIASDAITSTMGPKGKLVTIYQDDRIKFTKDGVSVAKSINLPDPLHNIGAKILISAANQTVAQCGDGTTATSLLTTKFIEHFYSKLTESDDPTTILKELDIEVEEVISQLQDKSTKVTSPEEIKDIATISSNSSEIGDIFYEIYSEIGLDSLVYLERPSGSLRTYYEVTKGAEFNAGFINQAFINDKVNTQVVFDNPFIHVSKDPQSTMNERISKLLSISIESNIPIVIIAPRFSDSFIRTCVMNKMQQNLQICLIQSPGYGGGIEKNQNDINSYLSSDGTVDRIVIGTHSFTLFNEDAPNLQEHISNLKNLASNSIEGYDQEDYLRRAHALGKTAATIFTGGPTPESAFEQYDRLEDAVGATRTAVNSGFLPGGGVALASLKSTILQPILTAPYYKICRNANISNPTIFDIKNHGYDFNTLKQVDYIDTGIVDPTNVVINSFKNAYESFKLIFNTSYIIDNNTTL